MSKSDPPAVAGERITTLEDAIERIAEGAVSGKKPQGQIEYEIGELVASLVGDQCRVVHVKGCDGECSEVAPAARPRSQPDPMAEVTASGLSRAEVHGIAAQLDREQQADCPHLRIGANHQGVLCRDCRKQWTGKEAERIWAELPSEGADAARPRSSPSEDLRQLVRDIGTVIDVASRRSDPDADHRAMLVTLRAWRKRLVAIDDQAEARSSPVEAQGWQPQHAVYSELQMQHARAQENANGFQKGWHAALTRVADGTDMQELRELVPNPALSSPGSPEPSKE